MGTGITASEQAASFLMKAEQFCFGLLVLIAGAMIILLIVAIIKAPWEEKTEIQKEIDILAGYKAIRQSPEKDGIYLVKYDHEKTAFREFRNGKWVNLVYSDTGDGYTPVGWYEKISREE